MGLSLVAGPTQEPVTLAEAKAHLRVAIADDDGLIAGYILAARSYVEGQIHRPIVSRMFDFTADYGWPSKNCQSWIDLPMPPLQSVRSVSYVDSNGATQVLASNQYRVITNGPRGAVIPVYGVSWPSVRPQTGAVTVRFIAGYTDFVDTISSPNYSVTGPGVPDELRMAIMLHVEMLYDRDPQSRQLLESARDSLMSPFSVTSF